MWNSQLDVSSVKLKIRNLHASIKASQECGRERYFDLGVKSLQHFGKNCVFRIFCTRNQKSIEFLNLIKQSQDFWNIVRFWHKVFVLKCWHMWYIYIYIYIYIYNVFFFIIKNSSETYLNTFKKTLNNCPIIINNVNLGLWEKTWKGSMFFFSHPLQRKPLGNRSMLLLIHIYMFIYWNQGKALGGHLMHFFLHL